MKKYIITNLCVLLLYFLSMPGYSQGFGASGLSMGGAYIAVARGVDAFAWNPANLSLSTQNKFELNLVAANINVVNSSLTLSEYERYFTDSGHHGFWDTNDIDHILGLIPDGGLQTSAEGHGNVMGLMFGRYGISAQVIGRALGILPKSLFELGLRGNQELYKEFGINDLDGDAFSAVKLSLSLSHPLTVKRYFDEFSIGLNVNYYLGLGEASVTRAEGAFVTTRTAILTTLDITSRQAEFGNGFGFDVGAAGKIADRWTVSMAFYNVLARINWTQQTEESRTYFLVDSVKIGEFEEGNTIDTTITRSIDPYTTSLPLVFHAGAAYQFLDNLIFALDIEQAFEERMGYSDRALLALGVQYSPADIVPIRAGMSFGGAWDYRFGIGCGLHLGFFHLDLAYAMHKGLWPTSAKGISTAANIKLVF